MEANEKVGNTAYVMLLSMLWKEHLLTAASVFDGLFLSKRIKRFSAGSCEGYGFAPDNSFYKSEGGTQSDTFDENEEDSDYDKEYEEDEDEEADNSMSDSGTLVINVSSLGNFTSKLHKFYHCVVPD